MIMSSYNVSRLLAQAECYNILATLFEEPAPGIHKNHKIFDKLVKYAQQLKPKELELAKKIKITARNLKPEDNPIEYSQLFSDLKNALAYPCGSNYISNQQGNHAMDNFIHDFYAEAGFDFNEYDLPLDHIIVELKFMYYLLNEIIHSFQNDDIERVNHLSNLRCRFVREHMIEWIPDFTRSILNNSKSPFYLQLAILTRTLLVNCKEEEIKDSH